MECVKLTNGTRANPALYIGLYRGVAAHLFGEAATDHALFRAAQRRRLYLAVGLVENRLVMRRADNLNHAVVEGWAVVEVRPAARADGALPGVHATVASFILTPDQVPGLIVEGRLGVRQNPRRVSSKQAVRNPRVAVHGLNEFDHPVRFDERYANSAPSVSFDVPTCWLQETGASTSFQPSLPLAPTASEERLTAQVLEAVAAPEPVLAPDASRGDATPGFYTLRLSPQLVEKMLLDAVASGRSILIDKSTGWIEIV